MLGLSWFWFARSAGLRGFTAFRHTPSFCDLYPCFMLRYISFLLLSLPLAIASGHGSLAFVPFYESLGSRPLDSFLCFIHSPYRKKLVKKLQLLFATTNPTGEWVDFDVPARIRRLGNSLQNPSNMNADKTSKKGEQRTIFFDCFTGATRHVQSWHKCKVAANEAIIADLHQASR